MVLKHEEIAKMLTRVAAEFHAQSGYLSEIDSRFGEGDHGVTIEKIAKLIDQKVAAWADDDIKEFLDNLGMGVMGVNGGSAGPLYGTLLSGLAVNLPDGAQAVDAAGLKAMLAGCLSEMEEITTARVGDKTMMDALIPAVAAAQDAPDDVVAIVKAAADAAQAGAKASEGFVSRFGRARSYKEQTIGTPDAGAVSTALLFAGLYQAMI